jgi:predicted 2-oxoglutarate/Fe(II)-dependent dioxygenase YbiX
MQNNSTRQSPDAIGMGNVLRGRPFVPRRNDPCFCGSGARFKSCCGSKSADRKPPHGIHVVNHFIEPAECRKMSEFLLRQPRAPLGVYDQNKSTGGKAEFRRDPGRVTDYVDYSKKEKTVLNWVRRAIQSQVLPFYGAAIEWFEKPAILYYQPGGKYGEHADSQYYDAKQNLWIKCLDRDYSLLIYLNDDFTGGELYFKKFDYSYRPRAGDLVLFPSNHIYMHEARPVTAGQRLAVVSWLAEKGQPKVQDPRPATAIPYDR